MSNGSGFKAVAYVVYAWCGLLIALIFFTNVRYDGFATGAVFGLAGALFATGVIIHALGELLYSVKALARGDDVTPERAKNKELFFPGDSPTKGD